jgi:hypothetical protein
VHLSQGRLYLLISVDSAASNSHLHGDMTDEKPDPLSDVIKGLGLLLRAARTTVERLPTKNLEDAVAETAREVGRAIENVASTVEREILGKKSAPPPAEAKKEPEKDEPKPPPDAG